MSAAPATRAIKYQAPPTLGRFLGSDAFVRLVVGPFGSGKSSACTLEILRRAQETPPGSDGVRRSRWVVVRNTYPELRDTTIPTFREWIPDALGRWNTQEHVFRMKFADVEAEVMFRALDRPDDVKKLLSLEATGAWINEAREVPRAVFELLQARLGRYPAKKSMPAGAKPWFGLWMDTNPPDTDHWMYHLFEENLPSNHRVYHQPGGRSPDAENLENLPDGYYDRIAAGKDADWIRVYVDGQYGYVRDGKPIFPEYNDALHCASPLAIHGAQLLGGMDFGLTPAAVLGQRDPGDGQIQIIDELVSEDLGAVGFSDELVRLVRVTYPDRPVQGWGDPAGEQRSQVDESTPFSVVNAAGFPAVPAPTNDFTLRREAVAMALRRLTIKGRPALVIHPRCKTLRKAMQGRYCYRRLQVAGRDKFADKPEKNKYSHVAEALQYLLVGEGEDSRPVQAASASAEADRGQRVALRFRVKRAIGR